MNEQFLSFIWKHRLFSGDLVTSGGVPVSVLKPGEQNSHSGPDFFNALIRIGETLWAGNVEIHVRASDWYRHHHHSDKAYGNVILHVVYEADMDIITPDLTTIPTLELKSNTDELVMKRYLGFRNSRMSIPCGKSIGDVNPVTLTGWLDRMLVQRLEHKSLMIAQALDVNRNDWEDAFYQLLARNFGFNVNAGPFEMLARCLPRQLLLRHASQPHQIESLVFGQAGFLETEFNDEYPRLLQSEYRFLSRKYGLLPLDRHIWKLLRMRPANFPTIRLSQFANLIASGSISLSKLLENPNIPEIHRILQVQASPYWNTHFMFDKPSRFGNRFMGDASIRNIIVNTVAPFLFYFGRHRQENEICEQAFTLLRDTPTESNHILDEWRRLGVTSINAFTGQALIGLYNDLCSKKKCLICALGTEILRKNETID
jgi:hypothetical protein